MPMYRICIFFHSLLGFTDRQKVCCAHRAGCNLYTPCFCLWNYSCNLKRAEINARPLLYPFYDFAFFFFPQGKKNCVELFVSPLNTKPGISEALPSEEVLRSLNINILHQSLSQFGITEVSPEVSYQSSNLYYFDTDQALTSLVVFQLRFSSMRQKMCGLREHHQCKAIIIESSNSLAWKGL